MLSVQKAFFAKSPYSSKTIVRNSRGIRDEIFHRRYGKWVPEKLLSDEEDAEKYKIHPSVKALAGKIIYSDYLEKKSLRFGARKNGILLSKLRQKARAKINDELMRTPASSIAVKYLTSVKESSEQIVKDEESVVTKMSSESDDSSEKNEYSANFDPAPIHMPYASTDSYEKAESSESNEDAPIAELNQDYVELYEKYLKAKEIADEATLAKTTNGEGSFNDDTKNTSSHDDTDVPPNWMTDYEQYDDFSKKHSKSPCGTADPDIPVSSIPCGGCGALLHCQDPALPGYLPSELFKNQSDDILRSCVCQRCHFLKYYNATLEVTVRPEDYPALLSHIKHKKVAVILMIDLTDFPCSIWSGVKDIVHQKTKIFIVGNKADLLPMDGPNCLKNVESALLQAVREVGIKERNIAGVSLVSAKTGYGIEQLINKLHKIWGYDGDVYLIGCTNVGKSSLFNALLRSDYCKIQAADLVQRATTSPWPGTTLSLLKFPILNPARHRLWMRTQRLIAERGTFHELDEYRSEMFKETNKIKYASLQGHIGQTFDSNLRIEGDGYLGEIVSRNKNESGRVGLDEKSSIYQNSRWCYDTPGAILPDQVLHYLTTEELLLTLPRHIITPRSFRIFKGQTLFIAGLGRLDFLDGYDSMICTIFASHQLPITMCRTEDAEHVYESLLNTEALVVPKNNAERLKLFPALESKDFEFTSVETKTSSVDVILSSAGWIALAGKKMANFKIRAWTPKGKGIHLRTPAMLSRSVQLRGYKIPGSQAYTPGKRIYRKK